MSSPSPEGRQFPKHCVHYLEYPTMEKARNPNNFEHMRSDKFLDLSEHELPKSTSYNYLIKDNFYIRIMVSCNMTFSNKEDRHKYFRGTYCLHFESNKTLKTRTACSSETLAPTYHTTQHRTPEDRNLNIQSHVCTCKKN